MAKNSALAKFYRATISERFKRLFSNGFLKKEVTEKEQFVLPETVADQMVENYLFNYQLPEGVALNFIIDGREVVVPMVTEEPSVIAAASHGAKIARSGGGFFTEVGPRLVLGQIIFEKVSDVHQLMDLLQQHENEILEIAKASHPSIVKRGGGVKKITTRCVDEPLSEDCFVLLELQIDVQEAMGANIVNTILEGITGYLRELSEVQDEILMSILSNYAVNSLATARVKLPVAALSQTVCERIVSASRIAQLDIARATTHNKGIMNGVDAVVLALGNDWRATEAAAHAYAAQSGQYRGLATWQIKEENLVGELSLPLTLGSVGGSTKIVPAVQWNQELSGINNATELTSMVVAVGLAQNLAALKALVTEGIQKGHMSLQVKSLALAAGAQPDEVEGLIIALNQAPHLNLETAQHLLAYQRKNKSSIRKDLEK